MYRWNIQTVQQHTPGRKFEYATATRVTTFRGGSPMPLHERQSFNMKNYDFYFVSFLSQFLRTFVVLEEAKRSRGRGEQTYSGEPKRCWLVGQSFPTSSWYISDEKFRYFCLAKPINMQRVPRVTGLPGFCMNGGLDSMPFTKLSSLKKNILYKSLFLWHFKQLECHLPISKSRRVVTKLKNKKNSCSWILNASHLSCWKFVFVLSIPSLKL